MEALGTPIEYGPDWAFDEGGSLPAVGHGRDRILLTFRSDRPQLRRTQSRDSGLLPSAKDWSCWFSLRFDGTMPVEKNLPACSDASSRHGRKT